MSRGRPGWGQLLAHNIRSGNRSINADESGATSDRSADESYGADSFTHVRPPASSAPAAAIVINAVPNFNASITVPDSGIIYQAVQFNDLSGAVANSWLWTFGDGSPNSTLENPVHYYPDQQPADYDVTLVVTDTNGCTDTASAVFTLIELLNVYIPNTITIDGDGVNDVFLPVFSNPDIIESYQLQIYNRWGNVVFETDNAAEGWDGRYKGKRDVQLGLYNWKIIYTDNKMVTRSLVGHVNVLR